MGQLPVVSLIKRFDSTEGQMHYVPGESAGLTSRNLVEKLIQRGYGEFFADLPTFVKHSGIFYDFFGNEITTKTHDVNFDPTNLVMDSTEDSYFTECDNWLFTRFQNRLDVYGTQERV